MFQVTATSLAAAGIHNSMTALLESVVHTHVHVPRRLPACAAAKAFVRCLLTHLSIARALSLRARHAQSWLVPFMRSYFGNQGTNSAC